LRKILFGESDYSKGCGMKGNRGLILWVDLSTREVVKEPSAEYSQRCVGGRGVNQLLLLKNMKPEISPFDEDNLIAFGTGPLAGTLAPGACRLSIDSKSPMTGGIASSSCGGNFAAALRFAGYENIIVKGRSEKPVYLFIDDDKLEVRDASRIWGRTTWETDELIKEDIGDQSVEELYIGPAGENLVRGACVITDLEKAAARCGLGAVMGSKRLKAIAVRGSGSVDVAESDTFLRTVDELMRKLKENEFLKRRGTCGIYGNVLWGENYRESPWRNFQGGYIPSPGQISKIHPDVFNNDFKQKNISCFSCPVHCRGVYRVEQGEYAGLICEGLENNDIQLFGAKLNVFDPAAILKLRSLCNQYGLDTDNTSGAIAWACECYERGIISRKETDGIDLDWGNYQSFAEMIKRIAYREGFGDILAEGSKRASQIVGRNSEEYAIHIKGQDLMEQIWVDKGWALGTVLSARGGGHTRGAVLSRRFIDMPSEISRKYYGTEKMTAPNDYKGKVEVVSFLEKLEALADSLGLCAFLTTIWAPAPNAIDQTDMANLLSSVTGTHIHENELLEVGSRIHNVEKAFNVLHTNWTREQDYPPKRFVNEPVQMSGELKGERLDLEKWDNMLDDYYDKHGWDRITSWPTRVTLENLGLKDIADVLKDASKLPL
jgi:aldehyde:ferredoxin oxidoreductase